MSQPQVTFNAVQFVPSPKGRTRQVCKRVLGSKFFKPKQGLNRQIERPGNSDGASRRESNNSVQVNTPSERFDHRSKESDMSFASSAGFCGKIIRALLRIPNCTREIPARVPVSTRTVENWINGSTKPSAENLIALMREFDEVADAVLEVSGRKTPGLSDQKRKQLLEILSTP